jgi:hypothetical protein
VTEHTRGVRPNHQVTRPALRVSVSCECAANDSVSMKLSPHTPTTSSIVTIIIMHVCLGITYMQNVISLAKAYARVHEMRIDYI